MCGVQLNVWSTAQCLEYSSMFGVQLNDRKSATDLMLMFGLNESIDQLVMANSVQWYGLCLLRRMVMSCEGNYI